VSTQTCTGEARDEVFLQCFAGCLSFLEQRTATSHALPATSGMRRQLSRERLPAFREVPDVRVIELRRRDYQVRDNDAAGDAEGPAYFMAACSRKIEVGAMPSMSLRLPAVWPRMARTPHPSVTVKASSSNLDEAFHSKAKRVAVSTIWMGRRVPSRERVRTVVRGDQQRCRINQSEAAVAAWERHGSR
jgi:hypothetical protein